MKIVMKSNGVFLSDLCAICRKSFEPADAIAVIENEDGDGPCVCHDCIAAGPDGMKERARTCAAKSLEHAKAVVRWAEEFAKETIEAPSVAEWESAQDDAVIERHGGTREELEAYKASSVEAGVGELF
ncbi:MAG TPA: hypothetical protein VFE47_17500 [Tepidisphaeraceae bacterium]|jgi:hypothetical protein|nr:hypothetical protein [Tepidisphaeraceae bacterium]